MRKYEITEQNVNIILNQLVKVNYLMADPIIRHLKKSLLEIKELLTTEEPKTCIEEIEKKGKIIKFEGNKNKEEKK